MADLNDLQASLSIKLAGATPMGGIETYWAQVDAAGSLQIAGEGVAGTPAGGVVSIQGVAGGTALPVSQSGSWTVAATQSGAWSTGRTWTLASGTDSVSAVQSGTWNITNITGTVSLPTGAATSALQTTGNTSLSSIVTNTNSLILAQGSTTSGQTGNLIMAAVTTAAPAYTNAQTSPLSLTTSGLLRVDASGTVQPVSQSGTWTVQPGNTANTTPWLVTVSTALPAGANNIGSVNQGTSPWIVAGGGTAGSPGTAVLTIQGIAGGTAIPISGTVTATNPSVSTTGTTPPASATYIGGSVTTAAPTYTTGQMSALSLTTTGLLRVDASGTVQPVSQSGAWTVSATQGTSPWIVAGGGTAGASGTAVLTIQGIAGGTAVPISGTVTATNPSVSATGAAPPASATYIGGSVTTAAPTYTTGQMSALSLTTSGLLRVDASGAIINAAQSGAWNITNITGTVSLPTGASTSALQTTGNTSLSTIATNTTGITVAQGSATAGQTGQLQLGAVTTAAPAYTTGQSSPLSLTTAGLLRVDASGTVQPVSQSGTWTVQPGNTANTTPWLASISQGGNTAAVKPASTAAVATDPALVVAISPNNPLTVTSANTIGTGTLGALNARVSVSMAGQSSAGMQLAAGTLIGTIVPNISYDNGVTWQATYWQNSATGELFGNFTFASANPAEGQFIIVAPGATNVSVVVTAYTSGTANVTISATNATGKSTLFDGLTNNPPPPTIVQVGAVAATTAPSFTNGNMYPLSLSLAGALRVDGSSVTQPISAAALPLPTGAATSTNQATEITSLQTIDNMIGPVGAGAAGTGSALMGAVFNTTQPTLTNGQQAGVQATARGAVIVATGVDALTVTPPTLTKGTQGATGFSVQELKDAGRNVTNYFMATQIITTATDTLQSFTGYKSGAAVGATTTPAVVTAGKTYRITAISITYIAVTTAGTAVLTLRANTGGVVAIGSPAVEVYFQGAEAATAGIAQSRTVEFPDGLEFAAGTGIGISVIGRGATGTAAATGYVHIAISGYEY